jgi:oligopeptide transport system ATP-binding protein
MLLSVKDLAVEFHTEYGPIQAVKDVSFDIDAGKTLAIVGESGSGKSVTGLAIMGLLPRRIAKLSSGSIMFGGRELTSMAEHEKRSIRGREIAMVFQDPMTCLNPVLTIGKQMAEVWKTHNRISWRDAYARSAELLRMVDMPRPERTIKSYPHQLSGGMRQRVMIAMALALEPRLLIADEPTTALDVTIQAQVFELLKDLTHRTNTAVILITHDLGAVAAMAEQVSVMYAGSIVESAPTTEIFSRPRHPYTVGLLNCAPRLDLANKALIPIDGNPPDPRELPPGCAFAPRCSHALEKCRLTAPPMTPAPEWLDDPDYHRFACYNPFKPDEERTQASSLAKAGAQIGQRGSESMGGAP